MEVRRRRGEISVDMGPFREHLQAMRKIYPDARDLYAFLVSPWRVWYASGGAKPPFGREYQRFNREYSKILLDYDSLARRYGFRLWAAFYDEPNDRLSLRRGAYLCSLLARKQGIRTWSPMSDVRYDVPLAPPQGWRGSAPYLGPMTDVLDDFNCGIRNASTSARQTVQRRRSRFTYYTTYPATSIRPTYNRFLHGMLPYALGVEVVKSYAYRDALVDPFDDLDCRANRPRLYGVNDFVLTYPSWQGDILHTLPYEALREGVEDSHLIGTLLELIAVAEKGQSSKARRLAAEAKAYLSQVIGRIHGDFRNRYYLKHKGLSTDPMEEAILRDLSAGSGRRHETFDVIRYRVCRYILGLQSVVPLPRAGAVE